MTKKQFLAHKGVVIFGDMTLDSSKVKLFALKADYCREVSQEGLNDEKTIYG